MATALDLFLICSLGFLGSFGHCAGMCGPLALSFTLSNQSEKNWLASFGFHLLLNLGRILGYGLVGYALGSFGSLLLAARLRQLMGVFLGLLLIWLGLIRIKPDFVPQVPLLHPVQGQLKQKLSGAMSRVADLNFWGTPLFLGLFWGLIPCGFLYIAQIKATETGNPLTAALTMLAFGLGTLPTMVGMGVSAARLSQDQRSQLFKLGGWITLIIGILTLLRSQTMIDYTGHGALLLLMLALIARPISSWWDAPLQYRRLLGVGSYILAIAHTLHMLEHSLNWQLGAVSFMIPQHRQGMWLGAVALLLMSPAAFTSSDRLQKLLGNYWRKLHLLSVPAVILVTCHAVCLGSNYLGELDLTWQHQLRALLLGLLCLIVLGVRGLRSYRSSSNNLRNS